MESLDPGWLAAIVEALRQRYGLLILRTSAPDYLGDRMVDDLDGTAILWEEESPDVSLPPHLRGAPEILLRGSERPGTPGELAALSRFRGGPVIRVIPAGQTALERRPPAATGEPWASVDWVARHLIGRKVGLALGAGGSKGYAHLGVLDELTRMNVPIDFVAGTSIGAPIAAGFAGGWSLEHLRQQLDILSRHVLRPTIPRKSFLSSRRLRQDISRIARGAKFEQLEIPLNLVAVDLKRRTEVVLSEGDVAEAIMASFAIPGIYPPVEMDGRILVDGGLLNPVPIQTVRTMGADVVIGVMLTNPVAPGGSAARGSKRRWTLPIVDTISQAFEVMQWKITTEGAAHADVTLEPRFDGPTGLSDFHRGDDFVETGRRSVQAARAQLQDLLPWINAEPGS